MIPLAGQQQEDRLQRPRLVPIETWRSLDTGNKKICIEAYDGLREALTEPGFNHREYSSSELQASYIGCYNDMTKLDPFFGRNPRVARILLDAAFMEFIGRVPASGEDVERLFTPGAAASAAMQNGQHSLPGGPAAAQVQSTYTFQFSRSTTYYDNNPR
jgi:hypothetical protein